VYKLGQDGKCLFKNTKGGIMCDKRWDNVWKGEIMYDKRWDNLGQKLGQDRKVFIYRNKRSNKVGQGTTVLLGEILFNTDTYYYY